MIPGDRSFSERQNTVEEDSIDFRYYLWILIRGKWVVLAMVLGGLLLAAYKNKTTMPVYRSSASFLFNSDNSMAQTLDIPTVSWMQIDAVRNDQNYIIKSRIMAEMVADSVLRSPDSDSLVSILFNGEVPERSYVRNALVGLAQSRISVSWIEETNFFSLSGTGYSPEAAAIITNLYLYVYDRWNRHKARGENTEVRIFLENQLQLVSDQLDQSESALLEFKERNGITDIDAETGNLISSLSAFETELRSTSTAVASAKVRLDYLTGLLEQQRESVVADMTNLNNDLVDLIQSDLARYESARAALLADGAQLNSPPVAEIEEAIAAKRNELEDALVALTEINHPENPSAAMGSLFSSFAAAKADYLSGRAREQALRAVVNNITSGMADLPRLEYELVALERNRQVNENIYILLRTRYEEVKIAEIGEMGNVTIVDSALPGGMILPKTKRNLNMGIMGGLTAAIALIFLYSQLDTSIRNPEDLERLAIPVVGVVPSFPGKKKRENQFVAMQQHKKSLVSEAVRELRTSLTFSNPDKKIKTLLVTSAGPKEGKSSISSNLAVAEAEAGKKVILLDCDLRRPVVNKLFGFDRKPGFAELVSGNAAITDVIRATEVEKLSVICSGRIPYNPAELIESAVARNILADIASYCDLLVIDSPPVAVVSDALLLSTAVDSTLLVVRSGKIQKKVVEGAWRKLQVSGNHLSGAVINAFNPSNTYTSYAYYLYKYQYNYSDKD